MSNIVKTTVGICLTALLAAGWTLVRAQDNPQGGRLMAEPVGSSQFWESEYDSGIDLYLVVNREKDRVGARFTCEYEPGLWEYQSFCGDLRFVFPQLRYDPEKKAIMSGTEIVAKTAGFGTGFHVSRNYQLGYEIVSKTEDTGFERKQRKFVQVYLEPKSVDPKKAGV